MTTMGEQVFTGPFGRLQPPSQEGWTPASAVSSFNLPLIYDSTLTTPISHTAESPAVHAKTEQNWHRTEPNTMQYPPRSYREGSYQYQSIHSKSKDTHLSSLSVPSDEMSLSISPYVFNCDSPASQCPPTPYWGSFGVSAPQSNSATNAESAPQNSSLSVPSASSAPRNQAPILQAPTPANLRPLKRAHDENLSPQAHQQAQETQQQLQAQKVNHSQQQTQPTQAQQTQQQHLQQAQQHVQQHGRQHSLPQLLSPHLLKRDSPTISPISTTSATSSHASKRRKQSSPPTPYSNPPSAHPSSSTWSSSYPTPSNSHLSSATPSTGPAQNTRESFNDKERLLFQLKEERDEEKTDWKRITERWYQMTGKQETASCLQMRYCRLRERIRVWTETDIRALISSRQKHGLAKWNTIATGMLEYGCDLKWSPNKCKEKWYELHPEETRVSSPRNRKGSRFSQGERQNSRGTDDRSESYEVSESGRDGEAWSRQVEDREREERWARIRGQNDGYGHGPTLAQLQGQQHHLSHQQHQPWSVTAGPTRLEH